jgi:hypothetical protein
VNRLTQQIALVLVSSSLALFGCSPIEGPESGEGGDWAGIGEQEETSGGTGSSGPYRGGQGSPHHGGYYHGWGWSGGGGGGGWGPSGTAHSAGGSARGGFGGSGHGAGS